MAVDRQGEGRRRVAEPPGNDVDRNAGLDQQSGVRVPQPVEVEGWYRRRGEAGFREFAG